MLYSAEYCLDMVNSDSNDTSANIQGHNIDRADLQIIEYLQADGRISYSYIARETEIPEATVRYRVKRLIDEEIIKISAFIRHVIRIRVKQCHGILKPLLRLALVNFDNELSENTLTIQ